MYARDGGRWEMPSETESKSSRVGFALLHNPRRAHSRLTSTMKNRAIARFEMRNRRVNVSSCARARVRALVRHLMGILCRFDACKITFFSPLVVPHGNSACIHVACSCSVRMHDYEQKNTSPYFSERITRLFSSSFNGNSREHFPRSRPRGGSSAEI